MKNYVEKIGIFGVYLFACLMYNKNDEVAV